jgi:probable O-glycosylation ligase (exosortase A-associated)
MLRSLTFVVMFLGLVPLTIISPFIGVLIWTWMSIMAPQELIFGFAAEIRWGLIIGFVTIFAWLVSRESKNLVPNMTAALIILFSVWLTLTTQTALSQELAWVKWDWVIRIMGLAVIAAPMITSKVRVHAMVWILTLSVGYFGAKGGASVLVNGGSEGDIVIGTTLGGLGDRNQLALALAMTLPLVYYLYLQSEKLWIRRGLLFALILTVFAILGTYSRGGLLGLAAVAGMMFLRSRARLTTGLILVVAIPIALLFMPAEWWGRMSSIGEYEDDSSAVNRLEIWAVCAKIGISSLFGGGFSASEDPRVVMMFDAVARWRAPHSIYLEVFGEHGVIGMAIWSSIMLLGWFNARWLARKAHQKPGLAWAADFGRMAQASLAAYFVAGAFLSMGYWTETFLLLVAIAGARQTVARILRAPSGRKLPMLTQGTATGAATSPGRAA